MINLVDNLPHNPEQGVTPNRTTPRLVGSMAVIGAAFAHQKGIDFEAISAQASNTAHEVRDVVHIVGEGASAALFGLGKRIANRVDDVRATTAEHTHQKLVGQTEFHESVGAKNQGLFDKTRASEYSPLSGFATTHMTRRLSGSSLPTVKQEVHQVGSQEVVVPVRPAPQSSIVPPRTILQQQAALRASAKSDAISAEMMRAEGYKQTYGEDVSDKQAVEDKIRDEGMTFWQAYRIRQASRRVRSAEQNALGNYLKIVEKSHSLGTIGNHRKAKADRLQNKAKKLRDRIKNR